MNTKIIWAVISSTELEWSGAITDTNKHKTLELTLSDDDGERVGHLRIAGSDANLQYFYAGREIEIQVT